MTRDEKWRAHLAQCAREAPPEREWTPAEWAAECRVSAQIAKLQATIDRREALLTIIIAIGVMFLLGWGATSIDPPWMRI